MNIFSGVDWVSAAIAFGSAVVTVFWPWLHRPEAAWLIRKNLNGQPDYTKSPQPIKSLIAKRGIGNPDLLFSLVNCGDSTAYAVHIENISFKHIEVYSYPDNESFQNANESFISRLKPGDSIYVFVWKSDCPGKVRINWTDQPTRLKRRIFININEKEIENPLVYRNCVYKRKPHKSRQERWS